MLTEHEPPPGAMMDRSTWLRRVRRAQAMADEAADAHGREAVPTVTDARPGLLIRWAVERREPLRMTRLDVYDPERGTPSRWDRVLRESLQLRFSSRNFTDLPTVAPALTAGGAIVVTLGNSVIGDPLAGLDAVIGGAAAGAGGYPLLLWRSSRRWRTIVIDEPVQADRLAVIVDTNTLATRLAARLPDDPETIVALDASRRLAWAVAELETDPTPDNPSSAGDARHAAALRDLDDAARTLRDRLAARDAQTTDLDTAVNGRSRRATRAALRARVREVRQLEAAETVAELARMAGDDLTRPPDEHGTP